MKRFYLICLFLLSLRIENLEAKTLEVILDHKVTTTVEATASHPTEIVVENIGSQPLKGCFPYLNTDPRVSLEQLKGQLADETYPLLALYQLWKDSLICDATLPSVEMPPLDLLNFKGGCCQEDFESHFIRLCQALGGEVRLANVEGKTVYDFCMQDHEWQLLDVHHARIYLDWDNRRLLSSEDLMDDPLLALRTQHTPRSDHFDIKNSWEEIARYDILEPASAPSLTPTPDSPEAHAQGFTLYPKETLRFLPSAAKHERCVKHTVCFASRQVPLRWKYSSPVPLHKVKNHTSASIRLVEHHVTLKPGESFTFKDAAPFHLLIAFSKPPEGNMVMSGHFSWKLFPALEEGVNQIHLGSQKSSTKVRLTYRLEQTKEPASMTVLNRNSSFDYCAPFFVLETTANAPSHIWWQISSDPDFQFVSPNLDQVEAAKGMVALSPIQETFLNPNDSYYFRAKVRVDGEWGAWSSPYLFVVHKPLNVEEVELNALDDDWFELNWERHAEEAQDQGIEYLVFGSNAFDFVPQIYSATQINAIEGGVATEVEANDNLIAITHEPKVIVKGTLAYYRILARHHGQLSVPSPIIHVYASDLIQPRNVLQMVAAEGETFAAKRTLFAASYPGDEVSLPHVTHSSSSFMDLALGGNVFEQLLLRSKTPIPSLVPYGECPPHVDPKIWEAIRPYLLPANHPAKAELDRIYSKTRVNLDQKSIKKAGFSRGDRIGRWSRVVASPHTSSKLKKYYFKMYPDCEVGIIYDWKRWIHRCEGAKFIRECIKIHNLEGQFKVPHKWIYCMPEKPGVPKSSKFVRKDFLLVCDNMMICPHKENEKMYKKKIDKKRMEGLYCILQVCGLRDSVYPFNIPFNREGYMCVIDTEYWRSWPVPFERLTSYFHKDLRPYWYQITTSGMYPAGQNSHHNLPRMDRRDRPGKKPSELQQPALPPPPAE